MDLLHKEIATALQHALPPSTARLQPALVRDIWAVALGLKTTTLLDTILLDEPQTRSLASAFDEIKDLRPKDNKLVVLHEPTSGQTLVGTSFYLLRHIMKLEERPFCRYVDVSGAEPILLPNEERPPQVGDLLYQVLDALAPRPGPKTMAPPSSFVLLKLKQGQSPQALIPFVGWILDYPVAYSLGDGLGDGEDGEGEQRGNCLGGRELTVFDVTWTEDSALSGCQRAQSASPCTPLLSFSLPTSLLPSLTAHRSTGPAGTGELQSVEQEVRELFQQRVKTMRVGAPKGKLQQAWIQSVEVELEMRTGVRLERVAL